MKKQHIQLNPDDRETLNRLVSLGQQSPKVLRRAMALLELDRGKTYFEVAQVLDVCYQTLARLKKQYEKKGLACLYDAPRSGRPVVLNDAQRAQIIALARSQPPAGHARWTLRLLAKACIESGLCEAISHTQVGHILRSANAVLLPPTDDAEASTASP